MTGTGKLTGVALGAGYFAPFQYEAWTRIPEVDIVAMCNRTEESAAPIQARYGVPRLYTDWRQMIDREQPDFIDIITPPETHEEICRYAAERGVHIICQKPLAPSYESRRIVESARTPASGSWCTRTSAGSPGIARQEDPARRIGDFTHLLFMMRMGDGWGADAYLARQPFFREYPRLLVYETGVHFIDTFRFLLGEVVSVFASLRRLNPVIGGEDAGQLLLTFASGATAIWDANRYNEIESASPRFTFGRCASTPGGPPDDGHGVEDSDQTARRARPRPRLPAGRRELRRGLRLLPPAALCRLHAVGPRVRVERRRLPGDDQGCGSGLQSARQGQVVRLGPR